LTNRKDPQEALDAFLAHVDHLRRDPEDELDWAPVIASAALRLAAELCGSRVLNHVYGTNPPQGDRQAGLITAYERLMLVTNFFATQEKVGSGSAIADVAAEAAAVAGGDYPVLFAPVAPKQGKRRDTYTRAMAQLRALQWDAYLRGMGMPREARRETITEAFGITTDAMDKWLQRDLPATLGADVVDLHVRIAAREGENDLWFTSGGTDNRQLQMDGRAYKRILGYE
jgi:hypothetical protein